jgi:hypothetical protein
MSDEQRHEEPDSRVPVDHGDSELLMSTWDDGEAAMIRQILESHGIPTQVVSHVPHSVWPITVDGLGEVRILVPGGKLEEAREVLAEHRRQGIEDPDSDQQDAGGGSEDGA